MAANIVTTAYPMLGGVDASAGQGGTASLIVGGTWAVNDTFLIQLSRPVPNIFSSLGAGTLTGQVPTFFMTYDKKLNLLFDTTWAFSVISNPLVFNDPNAIGNGYVSLSDAYSEANDSMAMAPFQGKVAVFGTNHIQIWKTDADPANYQLVQVLENIGTIARKSVQAFGELDVFFLHNTGVRSLRVRDTTLNGMPVDVGSQIDSLVREKLSDCTDAQIAAACGVIDVGNSQYWLFLKDTIFVLSTFPNLKINAWGIFEPTYQSAAYAGLFFYNSVPVSVIVKAGMVNDATLAEQVFTVAGLGTQALTPAKYLWVYTTDGVLLNSLTISGGLSYSGRIEYTAVDTFISTTNQTSFVPQDFVVYNQRVFVSTSDAFYVYGGADGVTYDNSICAFETSWLDFDSPAIAKNFTELDIAQEGTWTHLASPDFRSQTLQLVMSAQAVSTFAGGKIGWTNTGTHAKYRAQTTGVAAKAVLSNLLIHYKGNKQT